MKNKEPRQQSPRCPEALLSYAPPINAFSPTFSPIPDKPTVYVQLVMRCELIGSCAVFKRGGGGLDCRQSKFNINFLHINRCIDSVCFDCVVIKSGNLWVVFM